MDANNGSTVTDKKQFQSLFENYIDNLKNSTINKRKCFIAN